MNAAERFPLGVTAVMLPELDFDEQVKLCHWHGVELYVYRPRVIARDLRQEAYSNWGNHKFDLTPERLVREGASLNERLRQAGMRPFCTLPSADTSTTDEELDLHFRGAATGGCQRIRLSPADFSKAVFDYPAHLEDIASRYRRLIPRAQQAGLKIVIEMHVGNVACSPGLLHEIVREFKPEQLGVILDFPNLGQQGFIDPILAVSVLGPWIDHCHIGGVRRVDQGRDEAGCRQTAHEFCDLADGDLHLPTWIAALARLERTIPLIIEDFTSNMLGADRLRRSAQQLQAFLGGI